jgi:hypothetical protein
LTFILCRVRVAVDVPTRFARQDVLAPRAEHLLVGVVGAQVKSGHARLKRLPARFARQRLLTEAAFHGKAIREPLAALALTAKPQAARDHFFAGTADRAPSSPR